MKINQKATIGQLKQGCADTVGICILVNLLFVQIFIVIVTLIYYFEQSTSFI